MLSEEIMSFMLDKARKKAAIRNAPDIKSDVSEQEAMQIFNEIVQLLAEHNVSYQCACRIVLALSEAFLTGAVELYRQEQNNPIGLL